jgi:hypothetical protein
VATYSGNIHVVTSASGKTLRLTTPNPNPPPATNIVRTFENPPEWLWDTVVGNAGRPCTVETNDESGNPVTVAVS